MPIRSRLLLLPVIAVLAMPAFAQQPDPRAREARNREAAESVRRVERETGGEVLRAEPMQRGGREVYRLKVLTPEGRVRVMQDDPRARRERVEREAPRHEAARGEERRGARDDEPSGY